MRLLQGGDGSGNFGHSGRPGEIGGSSETFTFETSQDEFEKMDKFYDSLGKPQMTYTQESYLGNYVGGNYNLINNFLRGLDTYNQGIPITYSDRIWADKAVASIDEIPTITLSRDVQLYRGIKNPPKDWMPGAVIHEKAYTSATLEKETAGQFSQQTSVIRILGRSGQKLIRGRGNEFELIYPRGTTFRVTSRKKLPDPRYPNANPIDVIDLEVVE